MVREIQNANSNLLAANLAANSLGSVQEISKDNAQAAKNTPKDPILDLIDDSVISSKAKRLNEAYQFGKIAQTIDLPENPLVETLKNAVGKQGIEAVANQYDPDALAGSLLNSSAGAFLR